MSGSQLRALVSFLLKQTGGKHLAESGNGDVVRGERLFNAAQCTVCHYWRGEGGHAGPALDGVSEKIRRPWLVGYLQKPGVVVPNARMPEYGFSQGQAEDLAAYLGAGALEKTPSFTDTTGNGLSVFAQLGCAGCHRISAFAKPLDRPVSDASAFVAFHTGEKHSGFALRLRPAEIQAMAVALAQRVGPEKRVGNREFVEAFWKTPIPLQGPAPAAYDSLASRLEPEACGVCHVRQFADWQGTVHRRSMGSGVLGQLVDHLWTNPGFVASCQSCHAPAEEQHAMFPVSGGEHEENYQFDADAQQGGLTCAVCHVRNHVRFGPPAGDRPPAGRWAGPGHGGGVQAPAFEDAAFCRDCHQFETDGRRVNGKLLQDTYAQWLGSPQATEGETCQICHMPNRRHLWRGIHDPETVRNALAVDVRRKVAGSDSVAFDIQVRNTGAGHHFPTYVTPKLYVEANMQTGKGESVPGTMQRRAIGWQVVLGDEDEEVYDTRIPAGGSWVWRYTVPASVAGALQVRIEVHPDHFYLNFFKGFGRAFLGEEAVAMIDSAEARAGRSPYVLLELVFFRNSESESNDSSN